MIWGQGRYSQFSHKELCRWLLVSPGAEGSWWNHICPLSPASSKSTQHLGIPVGSSVPRVVLLLLSFHENSSRAMKYPASNFLEGFF